MIPFASYFEQVQEKAGERLDQDAVYYCYSQLMPIMDAVIACIYRRAG